jgi:hypothetical protein
LTALRVVHTLMGSKFAFRTNTGLYIKFISDLDLGHKYSRFWKYRNNMLIRIQCGNYSTGRENLC